MTTDLAVRQPRAEMTVLSNAMLEQISRTEFVPQGLRGNVPAILACVATGRALGLPDMTALRSIHIIDGKASFSAELMVSLVRRAGHSITGEVTAAAATVTGTRGDNGDSMTYTFTTEMAVRAGLAQKQNHKRYPEAMNWARAVSQLCRMLFADCFAGATYVPEELEGDDFASPHATAEPIDSTAEEVFGTDIAPPDPKEDPTEKQITYLNIAVGAKMDQATKRRVWHTVALMRVRDTDDLILDLGGLDGGGVLHWSPLRDTLTKQEAHQLIDKLEALEKQRQAEAAA